MKKRIFYSIFMALLLVTGCYKEEFGQVEKEMKHLRDTQIAPLSDQVSRISESISTLNVLSDELQEYITQIEQAGDVLQGNIGKINESIQALKESLSGKNSAAKGEVLAKLENTKSYLEVQLADMRSTSDVLKTKYDSLEQQIEALESLVANGYATKDWVKGTFATIDQQNAVIADVEAVKALISELSSSTFEIEGNIKDYIKKLRDAALAEVESSISQNVEALIGSYEMAISNTVSDIKDAYTKEIADAIKKSEDKVMEWVNGELNDYLTISAADAKAEAYNILIGNVPEGLTLQDQIDMLTGRIETLKSDITDAYKTAIEEAIETSEGKLTDQLTGGIASFRANDLKAVTDDVASLEDDVKTLWEDLGKLENRIKTLEEQAAAIEGSLDVLKGFHNSLEEYIDALKAELLEKDKTEAATLQKLVEALQYAVNGEDNASSLDAMIAELKAYVGTIPEGEASLVAWVESSTSLIDTQLEDYATIEYINGLKEAVNDTITDHSRRLEIVAGRLATAIDDSKSTIEGWISDALDDYMLASVFNGKLKTLDTDLKSLFTQGDSALSGKISDLRTAVGTAISELQVAYKAKIKSSIEEYNGYVTSSVDKKLADVKKLLYGEDGKGGINAQFEEFEATIDGMKSDVQTLNTEISSLKAKVGSLKTFITVEGYSSLKGIVNAVDTELGEFSGDYVDLTKFNAADLAVNGTGGYKESIDKLVQFKTDLEAAETAIDTYQALLKDFTLTDDNKTLKKQFDALNKELSDLKTAVFGSGTGNSLRDKLNAIVTKDAELKGLIDTLNSSLLSRVQSFTSIAFIPETEDGSAKFNFDGSSFSSTLYFAVRPKALSDAIADAAEIQWIYTATRALASLNPAPAEITSPEPGILAADVSFGASAMQALSKGISLALFASGDGFDFASEFVPVSGDRMYTDKTVLRAPALGTDNLKVKLYYPSTADRKNPQSSENWVSVNDGSNAAGVSGLSCREYTVTVSPSKSTSERTATITFTVSLRGGQSLSCSVDVIQEAREAQKITKFEPDTLTFSWNGHILDDEDKPTDKTSQDIIVTTSDSQTDWDVKETTETDWFSVEHLTQSRTKARVSFVAGSQNKNYNTTSKNRTGSITFTSATGKDTTFLFTQKTREKTSIKSLTISSNPVDTIYVYYTAKEYKPSKEANWASLPRNNGKDIWMTLITEDGSNDWEPSLDPSTNPWLTANKYSADVLRLTGFSVLSGTEAREVDVVISNSAGEVGRLHVVQVPREKTTVRSFTIGGDALEKIILNYSGKKYKTSEDAETWTDINFRNSNFLMTLTTEDGSKDWETALDPNTTSWIKAHQTTYMNGTYLGLYDIGENSGTEDRSVDIIISNPAGEVGKLPVTQQFRGEQRLTFDPSIETGLSFDYKATTNTNGSRKVITVTPSDGENDWEYSVENEYNWIHVDKNDDELRVWTDRNNDYETEAGRTGYIKFTTKGANPATYNYPVHQDKGVKRTFTFEERTKSGSNNQYYHIDEDGQLHVAYGGSDNKFMYVYVNSYPDDNWELNVSSKEDFLHVGTDGGQTRKKEGNKYYVFIKCLSANTGTEERYEEIVFTCDDGDYKVKVYQDARPEQRLTFDPTIESGGLSFEGLKTTNENGSRKAIGIISSDGKYDYGIEIASEYSWLHYSQNQDKQEVRVWTDANPDFENDRTGYITFTTKGSNPETYEYPVHQDKGVPQTFKFNPELKFSDFKAGDITTTVTPVPNLENDQWNVTDETIDNWLTVERQQDDKGFKARPRYVNNNKIKLTATKNNSPEPRTAKLIITAGGVSYEYTVTQPGRESQTFKSFSPASGTVNFSWDGYVIGSDGKSTSSTTQDITVTTSDGETDWDVAITNTAWATVAHRTDQNANKARITVGKGDNNKNYNLTGEDREGFITFTSANDPTVTSTYKFVQKARPAMTFTFSPSYIEIIKDYASNKSDKRKYRTSSSGDFTSVPYNSGKYYITLTVGVEGGGTADDWTCELISGSEWASAVKNKGTIQITPTNSNNTGVKQEIVISIKDNTTKEQVATYTFYKQGRASYTFKNLVDKTYAFDKTSDTFSVETSDGSKDWYVKVFAEDGVTEITDPDYWLKASTTSNSSDVTLTMSANNGNADRKAKIRFFTFDSAATITVTQTARPAQTFKSFSPNDIDGKTYSFAAQSIPITVETSDGRTDWTVSATGTGISVVKGESDNFATLKLSKNQSETDIINGSITFTSHGGSDVRTFNFTQDVNPGPITLSIGTIDTFDFVGGYNQKLTVTTTPSGNTDWTVEKKKLASEDNGWLSFEKVDGGVNVSAALNTGSARSTGLLFKSPTGEEYPVTVSQEAVGEVLLTFGKESCEFSADGGSESISISSTHPRFTQWNVNADSATKWLKAQKSEDGESVIVSASKNSFDLPLSGTVSFISDYSFVKAGNKINCSQAACLAAGTKIMMADGSLKNVEDIVEGDMVRTFNHEKGQIDSASICLTYKGASKATPLTLSFASGKKLSIVGSHGLLLQNTRKYVRINSGNVASFVGKSFYNAESGQWDKLISYKRGTAPVDYYCIYTTNHLNCIAEGMLTVPDDVDYFLNIYELDASLKADLKQLAADIKQYGLMDPRKDYPQYPELQALGESLLCKYLYIALAKGYVTEEEFTRLLEAFVIRWS